ncbi:hypothetical protein FO519_003687 [Halicephalobus sp. NKZ332]|nr:hypothetical protein FO519_003687 [Halicephalobus sp. NKZ332]
MVMDTYEFNSVNGEHGKLIHSSKAFVNGNGFVDYVKAEPPEAWTTPKNTKHWMMKCLPFRRKFDSLEGYSEDCLFLSILVPTDPGNKTNLLVFFSNENLNVIKILELMKKEVAVGVVYFRQGLQGFAGLNEEDGDYGISDIQLALDFIEKNADKFGISGSIALAGENDGSGILHLAFDDWHHKNKVERKYRLVLLNGHKLIQRIQPDFEKTRKNTLILFKKLDCDLPSEIQATDCARSKTFTEILKAFLVSEFHEEYGTPFKPNKIDEVKTFVDTVVGLESKLTRDHYNTVDDFQTNYSYPDFKTFLARTISDKKYRNGALLRRLIFHEYIRSTGDKKDTYFLWTQSRQVLQDRTYFAPTVTLLEKIKKEKNEVFVFKYDVSNPISTCLSAFTPEYLKNFCDQLWKFVLRFTTKGAPTKKTCGGEEPVWPALKSTKRDYYLKMDEDGKIEWDYPLALRADAFWNDLVPLFDQLELSGKRSPADENDVEIVHPLEEEDDQQQYHTVHRDEF